MKGQQAVVVDGVVVDHDMTKVEVEEKKKTKRMTKGNVDRDVDDQDVEVDDGRIEDQEDAKVGSDVVMDEKREQEAWALGLEKADPKPIS